MQTTFSIRAGDRAGRFPADAGPGQSGAAEPPFSTSNGGEKMPWRPAKALAWLERLTRANEQKLIQWLYNADFELLVSLFQTMDRSRTWPLKM